MKIRWRGHASFFIETGGVSIITDPFNKELGYPLSSEKADIITISHEHWDHNASETVEGDPQIIRGSGEFKVKDLLIKGIKSYHDKNEGKDRGSNTIYKICSEGISLLHLGDLGHILSPDQLKEIGYVDLLLLPVGGTFTIDAAEAEQIVESLKPKVVIPMHFNTPHLSFELAPVEDFTSRYEKVIKKAFVEIYKEDLTGEMKIIILDYLSC